jgi:hypothetical protein
MDIDNSKLIQKVKVQFFIQIPMYLKFDLKFFYLLI